MQTTASDRYIRSGRILFSLVLIATAAFYVYTTIHWRWMHDESVMRYVNFLMAYGKAPYRDIIDPNMPGSFFIDSWASHIFGAGDLGVRLYEFALLGSLTAAMIVIAWPYDWFAGLFAGVLFILVHGLDGPRDAVQREEIMTVLIVAGYAFLFSALRRQKPILMLPFGLLTGLAASLKPTAAPLGILLLLIAAVALRRKKQTTAPYRSFGFAGLLSAFLLPVIFLLQHQALGAFLAISKRLLPYYASVGRMRFVELIQHIFSARLLLLLFPIAVVLTIRNTAWKNWERWALALGVCFGAASYLVQQKGFNYHRYPFFAFFLLWAGLEFIHAIRKTGWVRALGFAGLALGTLYIAPLYAVRLAAVPSVFHLADTLEGDLQRLGGSRLQNQVQCLDMVSGCQTALYRLGLVQNTLFIGDYMFFPPRGYRVSTYDRDHFWAAIHRDPPRVIVMTNEWLAEKSSFAKLDQWPQLRDFITANYTLDTTRNFGPQEYDLAYRIYVLN